MSKGSRRSPILGFTSLWDYAVLYGLLIVALTVVWWLL